MELRSRNGHGFDRQLEAIEAYCKKVGCQVVEVFQEAVSGTTEETVETNTTPDTTTEETTPEETTTEDEATADYSTELVKENPYRYAGYYFDRKTQSYYLQARYYNPRLGRFISLDPIRGDLTNPLSLNRYVYAYNNPVNFIDPTGNISGWQWVGFAKGIFSGLTGFPLSFSEIKDSIGGIKDFAKQLFSGGISASDFLLAMGQGMVDPFMHVINNARLIWQEKPRDPSYDEVYAYGQNLGGVIDTVITVVASLFTGGATLTKMLKNAPDLLKDMAQKAKKMIPSGKNLPDTKSATKYLDDVELCNCFTEGTEIVTIDGNKPIEDIVVGDQVLAKDPETGEVAYKEVGELYRNYTDTTYNITI